MKKGKSLWSGRIPGHIALERRWEKDVKARTRGEMGAAKSLCTPFEQPELPEERIHSV
ncbi:hypothetical protein V6Z12_D04G138200 [Gossypium hirsutum]